jgi:Leucine-rich repeat (LRR) protein
MYIQIEMNTPGYREAERRLANPSERGIVSLSSLNLTVLPPIPNTVLGLYCSNNQLTQLPELPAGLKFLNCERNQLTQLPELPDGLLDLECNHNQLTRLPELPEMLTGLYCSNNQLTRLPELPRGLRELECNYNQLTRLPELPNNLHTVLCFNNPFQEPLHTFITTIYRHTRNVPQLRNFIRAQYAPIKAKGRNLETLYQTLPRRLTPRGNYALPENVLGRIGTMITGNSGHLESQSNRLRASVGLAPHSQAVKTALHRNVLRRAGAAAPPAPPAPVGGRRKTRKGKRSNKKSRKHTRKH